MKKRNLAFVCVFAAALVFAYWGWSARQPNEKLLDAVHSQGEQLSFEQKRIENLRASLAQVQGPPAGQINDLKERIAQTESQLKALGADKAAVNANSQEFKANSGLSIADQIVDLQRQIQEINAQIARLKAQIAAFEKQEPTEDVTLSIEDAQAEIQALTLTRDQLNAQIQIAKTQGDSLNVAASRQAQAEQFQILSEEQQLQVQLEDLRSDLDYWENAQASRAPASQQARIVQLQKKIDELEKRLR